MMRRLFSTIPKSFMPNVVSAQEAVSHIQSGNHIYIHSIANYPAPLVSALAFHTKQHRLQHLHFYHLHLEHSNPFDSDHELFEPVSYSHHLFIGKRARGVIREGHGSYLPVFLSDIPILFKEGRIPLDWALLQVSPPDRHGYCSLGLEVCAAKPAAMAAKKVIALINPNMPRTLGNSALNLSCFDFVVELKADDPEAQIPSVPDVPPTELENRIGQHIAQLVPDGSTLQIGIGGIPNAALLCLKNHKNLGIHSEMISDGVMHLLKCGAVNNIYKEYLPDRTVTSFILGSLELYDYVNDNPAIHMDTATITNTPRLIARNPCVVAINSALEIDLSGQVCADSIGTQLLSGIGGQLVFLRGAALSKDGRPIIAMASRTNKGDSKIVGTLKPGAGVTTTRYHCHYVVTEYGWVDLWGLDMRSRCKKLISIAHPDEKEKLAKAAYEHYKILIQ